jgi:hypothetical protein
MEQQLELAAGSTVEQGLVDERFCIYLVDKTLLYSHGGW